METTCAGALLSDRFRTKPYVKDSHLYRFQLPTSGRTGLLAVPFPQLPGTRVKSVPCRDAQHLPEAITQHQVGRIAPPAAAVPGVGVADIAATPIRHIPFLPLHRLVQAALPEVAEAVQAVVLDHGGHRQDRLSLTRLPKSVRSRHSARP